MRGLLNGRTFNSEDMMAVAEEERLPAGKPTIWTFVNDAWA